MEIGKASSYRRAALGAVAAGNFMVQLAMMPISTILPTVAHHFGVEPATVAWVMTAYLLTLTGLVLTTGRLGDLYGHRRIFLLGTLTFTLGAVVAGLAPSLLVMIAARALQGVGGALMMGNALAILVQHVPVAERARGIGLAAVASSVGSLVGVVIGSFLLKVIGWQWVFLVVAPSGLITLLLARRLPPDSDTARPAARPDVLGAALLFLMLGTLSLSFTHLHDGAASFEAGWPYHTTMQLLTAGLLAAFIVTERLVRQPMMPLDLFRHRRFTMAILANGALHMTMMGSMFLVPFLVEQGLNRPPSTTGLLLIPMQLTGMAASYIGGWLYDRTQSRWLAPVSLLVIGLGMGLLGLVGLQLNELGLLLILAIVGAATNLFMTANNTAVMASLPQSLCGFASGMLETSRQLGHSVAVALAAGVLGFVAEQGTGAGAAGQGLTLAILSFAVVALVGVGCALAANQRPRPAAEGRPALVGADD